MKRLAKRGPTSNNESKFAKRGHDEISTSFGRKETNFGKGWLAKRDLPLLSEDSSIINLESMSAC